MMTEVTGLVVGAVAAWKTCVQVFDIVDSERKYGTDYELLCTKLESKIRLMAWGDAVGLSEVEHRRPSPDTRLNQENVCRTVLRVLGCIQHVFEHSERLQETYGLCPTTYNISDQPHNDEPPTQSQLILGSFFKRAYENLRRSAKDRQHTTPSKKKTVWAVYDMKKFQAMLSEIKGFNDMLESLFPDAKSKTLTLIRNDIDQSEEVHTLQLLQEATADEHEDISETASVRLEALGPTTTAQSALPEDARTITGETNTVPQQEGDDANSDAPSNDSEMEMD